ncbi:NYN domain limkain-b1-type [Arabidopsis suecica]|uniref:NYN domain limkain-b1-type n=1 Tax=Arabidopsis suecica TaxID=45249 RepID=A0A8T2GYQ5_ARASU|nr:NYN domain limkain-b1-type [Arabidopsis suecica]
MMKKPTRKEAAAAIRVAWDINKCPVPDGYDPRMVRPSIKRFLEKKGYYGPLTVVAFGDLAHASEEFLRQLFSSGIHLTNVTPKVGRYTGCRHKITYILSLSPIKIQPPANFMAIADPDDCSLSPYHLKSEGYNPLKPFMFPPLESLIMEDSVSLVACEPASWDCLLSRCTLDPEAVKSSCPTFVYWDINSCPVPSGFDASLVGPCIKHFLKKQGCYGPLTITAIGVLTDVPNDILSQVYHSGINLQNVAYGPSGAYEVIFDRSKRSGSLCNLMVISDARIFAGHPLSLRTEFNFLKPYPCDSLLIFLEDSGALDDSETAGFCFCSLCQYHTPPFQAFESFTTHLSGTYHQQKLSELLPISLQARIWNAPKGDRLEENITLVFWDINTCPVPPECDPRQVAPFIKRFLSNKGCSGPLTIIAIGVLTDFPIDILRALYSSGITLMNIPPGARVSVSMNCLLVEYTLENPPPANILLISEAVSIFPQLVIGSNVFKLVECDFRESLFLAGALEEDRCSETSESSSFWICMVCDSDLVGQGFENFTTHVTSRRHQRELLDWLPSDDRFHSLENDLDQGNESARLEDEDEEEEEDEEEK